MRRSDREITDFYKIIEIIKKCDVCRLAINDNDYPYIIPMNFGLDVVDNSIILYFHCANNGRKLDLIRKNNNVSFEMDTAHRLFTDDKKGSCSMEYESVIGNGFIEFVPEQEKFNALKILMKQYHKENFEFNIAVIPKTTVFKLTVKSFTAKQRKQHLQ